MYTMAKKETLTMKEKATLILILTKDWEWWFSLDYGEGRAKVFDVKCPDEGRVCIHGEVID